MAAHILIVDDDPVQRRLLETAVRRFGYQTTVVDGGEPALKLLESPDENPVNVVVLDLAMPGIDGHGVLRRMGERSIKIPVIVQTANGGIETAVSAMRSGAVDFIVKPAEPKRLISAVTLRIRRARLLRGLMVRDGLTGLFNHTAIKEQLNREIVRSNRLKTPLSFAMIDVDFFKKVNDKHGHAAGDRVLKSLARLLKQRLRGTDIVGRYGGEEFAVILTDTDAPGASRVIDEIRNVFSRLIHMSDNKEFTVTFSCGIADIKHFPDTKSISNAADKALYKAKKKGRNQVMISAD